MGHVISDVLDARAQGLKLDMRVVEYRCALVDLLLLVDRELSRTHVDQQEETTATFY